MTIGVQAFRGARLKEARLARGLYKNSLADLIGVTGTAIARYEDGIDNPHREKLEAIAEQLKFPVEFFLRPEWPEKIETVFWRSRIAETKHAREMTEQRMTWLCEVFSYMEREVDFPEVQLPDLDLPKDPRLYTPEDIERAAEEVRRQWKLHDMPIGDVMLALENAGIPVVALDIPSDKQDGFCFKSHTLDRVFVGINKYEVSAVRARYDAAHELGHAILHKYVNPQQLRDAVFNKLVEQQAHRFAGAFLFPRKSFQEEIGAFSLDYFSSIKKRWGISIAAMIYRASDLGYIDEFERGILYRNMTRRRWKGPKREPFDDEMVVERPRMLRRGIEAIVEDGAHGRSIFRSALALPDRELEQITGLESGYFSEGHDVARLAIFKRSGPLRATDAETGQIVEFPGRRKR